LPALFGLLTRGALGWAAALIANPIAWIVLAVIAGVVLLGVAVYEVVKHWKDITAWVTKACDAVKRFFTWRPPAWLAQMAAIAVMMAPGGAVIAPAIAAAAAPGPKAPVRVEQHFHIHGAEHIDHKALAREMKRMSDEGLNKALSDAGSE
jgi:hypothetical protein